MGESNFRLERCDFNKRRAEGRDRSVQPKKLRLNTKNSGSLNSGCYLQILGTGMDTHDTCPSVLLFFDNQRFVFNAGEGLQRYMTEYKTKLSQIDHILFSRVCSETAGGLPGLLLTMAGMEKNKGVGMCVNIWGPSGISYLIDALKTFVAHNAMLHTKSFGPPTPQHDKTTETNPKKFSEPHDLIDNEFVKISAILLRPNETIVVQPSDISVIYVCELPKIPGKFHSEKAEALGLRRGRKLGDLQKNVSVKSDELDIMVHPRDVMDPPIPGPIVLLVDCPTTSHLQSLLSLDTLNLYYTDVSHNMSENAKVVNCVIHLSPSSVFNSPDYKKWMKRFGHAEHIMGGHENKNIGIPVLKSSARVAARLNYLCPQFFPAPGFWTRHVDNYSLHSDFANEGSQAVISGVSATISAQNLMKFILRPHRDLGIEKSSIPNATRPIEEIVAGLHAEIPKIVDVVQQVKQLWVHPEEVIKEESSQNLSEGQDDPGLPSCLKNTSREDMEIILLGTGSSQPSKYRNVSSIFINLFSKGGLLLDCGEGTLAQLKRRFGVEVADDVVRSLRFIWISHIHADHHSGVVRILALRRDLLKNVPHEPLIVLGPKKLLPFFDAYQRLEKLDMQFLNCECTTRDWGTSEISNSNSDVQILNHLEKVLSEAGLETLISFHVVHCEQSFGVSIKAAQRINNVGEMIPGWKIVYSGDTRPCRELVDESRGATVLIHEATFEDDFVEKAMKANHSTITEAIETGKDAGVYRLILTHFSQRYPKLPVLKESLMQNTCIGFDLMSINLADLPVLPQVLPHLKLLFQNDMKVEDVKDCRIEKEICPREE